MRHKVSRRSLEDPAATSNASPNATSSKYYSVPHRGDANYSSVPVSKQRSLEGEQFRNLVQQNPLVLHQQQQLQNYQNQLEPSGSSSISRSVSFMGGRQPPRSQQESPAGTGSSGFGAPAWRASFDSGGRRSVESTPQSSRRQQQQQQQQQIYSSASMKSPSEKGSSRTRALPPAPTSSLDSQGENFAKSKILLKLICFVSRPI